MLFRLYAVRWNQDETGLKVHPDKGLLAASPDGIVYQVGSGATGFLEIVSLHTRQYHYRGLQ